MNPNEHKKLIEQIMQKIVDQHSKLKNFLETASLYQKYENFLGSEHKDKFYSFLPLMIYCPKCKMKTTFHYVEAISDFKEIPGSQIHGGSLTSNIPLEDKTVRLEYQCQHCKGQFYSYLITESNGKIFKSGQNPSILIEVSDVMEKKLGPNLADYYKKGKTCESHGYGIATMAYYRRIVEDKIKELLTDSISYVNEAKREEYTRQVNAVIAAHNFDQKADAFYDLMPEILKPGGHNLIKALFSKISEGLHAKDDNSCLLIAKDVSELLEIIIVTLNSEAEKLNRIKILQKKV